MTLSHIKQTIISAVLIVKKLACLTRQVYKLFQNLWNSKGDFFNDVKSGLITTDFKHNYVYMHSIFVIILFLITQRKSNIPITRSVHCKFNCITVTFSRTRQSIYIPGTLPVAMPNCVGRGSIQISHLLTAPRNLGSKLGGRLVWEVIIANSSSKNAA